MRPTFDVIQLWQIRFLRDNKFNVHIDRSGSKVAFLLPGMNRRKADVDADSFLAGAIPHSIIPSLLQGVLLAVLFAKQRAGIPQDAEPDKGLKSSREAHQRPSKQAQIVTLISPVQTANAPDISTAS